MFTGLLAKTQQIYQASFAADWQPRDETSFIKEIPFPTAPFPSLPEQRIITQLFFMIGYARGYPATPCLNFNPDNLTITLTYESLWTPERADPCRYFDDGLLGKFQPKHLSPIEALSLAKVSIISGDFINDRKRSQNNKWAVHPENPEFLRLTITQSHGLIGERFYYNGEILDALNDIFKARYKTDKDLFTYQNFSGKNYAEYALIRTQNIAELGEIMGFTTAEFRLISGIRDIPSQSRSATR